MKVVFNEIEHLIQFSHRNYHKFTKKIVVNGLTYTRQPHDSYTYCRIYEVRKSVLLGETTTIKNLVASGKAICSSEDQFIKDKGRRIALQNALKDWRFETPSLGLFGSGTHSIHPDLKQGIWDIYNAEMKPSKK